MHKITPCLWFDTEGEEAANLYTSLFPNSRIVNVSYYGDSGPRPAGTVLTVEFELDGETSSSRRRSRSKSPAKIKPRSTTTGTTSAPAVKKDRADG